MSIVKRFVQWVGVPAAAALAVVLLMGTVPAGAHPIVLRTDPVDGAVLAEAPKQARVWFGDAILLQFTTAALYDSANRSVPLTSVGTEPNDRSVLVVDFPELKPNAYRLTWHTVSSDDFHAVNGSIVFGVQQSAHAAIAPTENAAPTAIEVAMRWLNFAALSSILGALAIALVVVPLGAAWAEEVPPGLVAGVRRRLLWLSIGASVFGIVIGIGLLFFQASVDGAAAANASSGALDVFSLVAQIVTQTEYGARWLMQQGLRLMLAVVIIIRMPEEIGGDAAPGGSVFRSPLVLATAPLVVGLVGLHALNSHSASLTNISPVSVLVDGIHLLAASQWAGGLLALSVAIAPLLRRGQPEAALAWSILRRFGALAAISAAVLLVTGLYNTGQLVASIDALLVTSYGRSLIVKLGLVAIVAAIGLFNSATLHPRLAEMIGRLLRRPVDLKPRTPRRLSRTVWAEAAFAMLVLLMAAMLTSTPPARDPRFDPPIEEPAAPRLTSTVNDLLMTLSIKPNRPGQNFILLDVFNTRRPAPAPFDKVSIRLRAPGDQVGVAVIAEPIGEGHYQVVGGYINADGQWQIAATVSRPGMPDAVLSAPWVVSPAVQTTRYPVVVSNRPLAPWLTLASILTAVVLGCGLIVLRLRKPSSHAASASAASRAKDAPSPKE